MHFGPSPLLLAALLLSAGCGYTEVRQQCPTCTEVSRYRALPPIPTGTRTLFLIVPGLLGFGWEWDDPLVRLRAVPDSSIVAFSWRPSSPVWRVAGDLAEVIEEALHRDGAPERVVVLGHSAGGLVTALAGSLVRVPARSSVHIVNIGTPYAGMHTTPFEYPLDGWHQPVGFAIGGVLTTYPRLRPRVTLESWITPYPGDPVMKPRFGHHPDDPRVGPPGPRRSAPPGTDHNRFVTVVVEDLLARTAAAEPRPVPHADRLAPTGASAVVR